eukprot:4418394-Amphidinium_carterae.1
MSNGTLNMSASVGPGACAIAGCGVDDGWQAGPSGTDSWTQVSRCMGGKVVPPPAAWEVFQRLE